MNNRVVHTIDAIVSSPAKNNGRPTIDGTGVSVDIVSTLYQDGVAPAEIAELYDLSLAQIFAALSYYYDHQAAIETAIEGHEAAAAQILDEEYVTVAEAAELLGKSEEWVRALCRDGRLPAARLGRAWLVWRNGLDNVRGLKAGYPRGRPRNTGATQ